MRRQQPRHPEAALRADPPQAGHRSENILDSARTAVAEGHKETGEKAGDHGNDAKSSSFDSQSSSDSKSSAKTPSGDDLIAAAIAFLTGETPPSMKMTSGSGTGSNASVADVARTSAASTTEASPAAKDPSAAQTDGSAASSDSLTGDQAPAQDASAQARGASKADTPAPPQVPLEKGGQSKSDSKADGSGTAPVATGAYKPQVATANAAAAQPTTSEGRSPETQQTEPVKEAGLVKPQADGKQPADDGKQVAGIAADAAKPATAATSSQTQSSALSTPSPVSAQQSQTGTGGHSGTGSEGHGSAAGQQGSTPADTTATNPTAGSASGNEFSVPASSSADRVQPSVKLPEGVARSAVTLQEAVDAVKATFTAANQAGISSARISLSPESLGGIKISLSQTPDGLIARVTADHPEAAQTLQQSAGELKRSLEAGGMSLLRLDIGSSGEQGLGGSGGSQRDGSSADGSWNRGQADGAEEDATSTQSELTVELPSGSLVNVLA